MALVNLEDVEIGWGSRPLIRGARLVIEQGEKIGLVGRNGAGKSTLLRLLSGQITADEGRVERRDGIRVAMMPQEASLSLEGKAWEVVAEGLGEVGRDLVRLHEDPTADVADASEAWAALPRVEAALQRVGVAQDAAVDAMSGGERRRVLLASALVQEPDLLLLDEPTNHLDMEAVQWLEGFLRSASCALLFVTHDRAFLQAVATRIVEVDRGTLRSWECDYRTFLERRERALEDEEAEWAREDKRLKEEEAWARQGVKARRTRAVARVKALEVLRKERAERRERVGQARITMHEAERSGRLVLEVKHLDAGYPGVLPVVRDLSLTLMRGDRVGIIGPNGVGKTTLLRTLIEDLPPLAGSVRSGTKLQVVVLDQLRETLDEERTVFDTIADGAERVSVRGQNRHVMGYLQEFLFPPERARVRVGVLSGGERARLLLARLFLKPVNLLVLDEPTNDLDLETLDVLEEQVTQLDGTVLVISHDRAFLDAVCTSMLVFEGDGHVQEYVGGYSDWLRQRPKPVDEAPVEKPAPREARSTAPDRPRTKEKLSWKEERALEDLPGKIETLEAQRDALVTALQDPALYAPGADGAGALQRQLDALESSLEEAYATWFDVQEKAERLKAALLDG